jgi:hypothetical protein
MKEVQLLRVLGLALLLIVCCGAWADVAARQPDAMRGPAQVKALSSRSSSKQPPGYPAITMDAYLHFFQRVISPVDGARSNMYPTGSDYARRVFRKHGALLGIMLTTERLMHEGNEIIVAPRIKKYGIWRVYDPVEANDWWWLKPDWVYVPRPPDAQR